MLERLRARGMFVYKRRWLLLDAVRGLGLFAGGFVAMDSAPPLAFVLLVAALLNAMWWVHDVCHDSVFRDRAVARWWAELVSIVFVGTSILDYQYVVHRHHHGFTNTIAADPALDTGPVVWHEAMRSRTTEAFKESRSSRGRGSSWCCRSRCRTSSTSVCKRTCASARTRGSRASRCAGRSRCGCSAITSSCSSPRARSRPTCSGSPRA